MERSLKACVTFQREVLGELSTGSAPLMNQQAGFFLIICVLSIEPVMKTKIFTIGVTINESYNSSTRLLCTTKIQCNNIIYSTYFDRESSW